MRQCSICGKGYKRSFSRSHSMRATVRKLHPNIQWMTIKGRRVQACTKCIKSANKRKAKVAAK